MQQTLDFPPCDSHVNAKDVPRLGGQNADVLARLRRGPVTNIELVHAGILRAAARVWDLKRAGYDIVSRRLAGGQWEYRLRT